MGVLPDEWGCIKKAASEAAFIAGKSLSTLFGGFCFSWALRLAEGQKHWDSAAILFDREDTARPAATRNRSFMPQRYQRIHASRASCRQIAREQGDRA